VWSHHGHSPGIPTARGLMDHPPTQHPHLPHPAYLHPAYYSPIGMVYSYIAHPYPPRPPSSSPPDSSSRKRAVPDEPQTSRSKRKRLNAKDAVESKSSVVRWRVHRVLFVSQLMDHAAGTMRTSGVRLRRTVCAPRCLCVGSCDLPFPHSAITSIYARVRLEYR
jgi:hypothetical protein